MSGFPSSNLSWIISLSFILCPLVKHCSAWISQPSNGHRGRSAFMIQIQSLFHLLSGIHASTPFGALCVSRFYPHLPFMQTVITGKQSVMNDFVLRTLAIRRSFAPALSLLDRFETAKMRSRCYQRMATGEKPDGRLDNRQVYFLRETRLTGKSK